MRDGDAPLVSADDARSILFLARLPRQNQREMGTRKSPTIGKRRSARLDALAARLDDFLRAFGATLWQERLASSTRAKVGPIALDHSSMDDP